MKSFWKKEFSETFTSMSKLGVPSGFLGIFEQDLVNDNCT